MDSALLAAVADGDRRALSKAISAVESGDDFSQLKGDRRVIGVTGPPGVGKSTLIASMIEVWRRAGESVAVLAVDPSSPITGGAILGDRIRMQNHIDDGGVYIRSMATRGHLGGLAEAASDAAALLSHAGFDHVVIETVGVGQSEVEVMNVADTVVLVLGPAWGDQVQADKAGIVEIANVFVINKGDRPGVNDVRRALHEVADSRGAEILVTTATSGEGVAELVETVAGLLGA